MVAIYQIVPGSSQLSATLRYRSNQQGPMDGSLIQTYSDIPVVVQPAYSTAGFVPPIGNATADNQNQQNSILVFLSNSPQTSVVEGLLEKVSTGMQYISRAALTLIPTLVALFLLSRLNLRGENTTAGSLNSQGG